MTWPSRRRTRRIKDGATAPGAGAPSAATSSRARLRSAKAPPKLNLLRIEEDLSQAHLRLAQATIECLPWDECIRRYDRPHTLFYCDPPYWGTEGYGVDFGLEIGTAEIRYSVGGSGRTGKTGELIITNFPRSK